MNEWHKAKHDTIARWQAIRYATGAEHPLDLLIEVNQADALCDQAAVDRNAAGAGGRCEHCPMYQQFGGCQVVLGGLSERIAAHDWTAVRAYADEMIGRLRALKPVAT
jgi:hypothetical protein